MPIFVHVLMSLPKDIWYKDKAHTDYINEILTKLQQRGAKITSVNASISHARGDSGSTSDILYVIAYEAPGPISL